jgi:hypothetical protein
VDDRLEAREPCADLGDLLAAVDQLLAVAVTGDGEEHFRLELPEPVEDAADAELGRTRRPDRAEARGREERDERLRDVRQVRDDPVTGTDAETLEAHAGASDLLPKIAERQLHRLARLRVRDDRDGVDVLVTAEHVLRVVQPCTREPLRAGHLARAEHPLVRGVRADLVEVPDRGPEGLEVGDRPAPELLVAGEVESALAAQPLEIAPELEALACVCRRLPQDVALREWPTRPRAHRRDPRLRREPPLAEVKEATTR